jgi:carbonic anhydrase
MAHLILIMKDGFVKSLLPILPALAILGILVSCKEKPHAEAAQSSARPAHWGYEGTDGPEYWPTLNPAYAACGQGKSQSPINITQTTAGDAKAWKLDYKTTSLKIAHHEHVTDIVDNGHTIQVSVDEGSTLTTERGVYTLKQFHFHAQSEHTIDGSHFPLEVHFVHQSAEGKFAVVSALFQEGEANENLAKIIAHFPKAKGESSHLPDVKLDLIFHLPATAAAYTYMGSLTTPPCSENVEWLVFRDPVSASKEQLEAFSSRLSPSNRPTQPLNGRVIGNRTTIGKVEP